MSNGTELERLFKLQAKVNSLVAEGKRDPKMVSDAFQEILEWKPLRRVEPTVVTIEEGSRVTLVGWPTSEVLISDAFEQYIIRSCKGISVNVFGMEVQYRPVCTKDKNDLPYAAVFRDIDQFLGLLITLLRQQRSRHKGVLLRNRYRNHLYVNVPGLNKICGVTAGWNQTCRRWEVGASILGNSTVLPLAGVDRLIFPA